MKIAREGYRFIIGAAVVAVLALIWEWTWLTLGSGLLAVAFVGFFRDPERIPPEGDGLILSPADGKVVGIHRVESEGPFGLTGSRVSIFLSPLDVHVNRAPVKGSVESIRYRAGKFFAAYRDKASEDNEQNALKIVDGQGRSLGVVQIAGVVARRIVCYVRMGDALERGQRLGLIMFGSRVDLFLPEGSRVEVVEGQRVRGGETIIGRFS